MALPQGINFRATTGYVTDGTNETYEIGDTNNYPRTSAQGNNVGWEVTISDQARNRNSSNDRRLAGMHQPNSNGYQEYRIDLPSTGDYKFRLAMGDANYAGDALCTLYDTTTSLGTLSTGSTSAANSFRDAANTQYTAANWPGSNSLSAATTFSSTICRFRFGDASTQARVAHVWVESAGGGGGTTRGSPFGARGNAFNGGRTFWGIIRRVFTDMRLANA